MAKNILVDYHCHPNFSISDLKANEQAKIWWKGFEECKLGAVLVTEHSYKNPARAYRILLQNKPKDSTTEIFPGVEALTEEGIDFVVFAKTEDIYAKKELLTPYYLTIEGLLNFIKEKSLYGFVTHPFTPGTTSIVEHKGEDFTLEAIKQIKAVEAHNASFDILKRFMLTTNLRYVLAEKFDRILKTENLPENFLNGELRFIAGGSDAHHPSELGCGFIIQITELTRDAIFEAIINNRSGKFVNNKHHGGFSHLLPSGATVFAEWIIKNLRVYKLPISSQKEP